jgi:biopolymer transport protein TolQ
MTGMIEQSSMWALVFQSDLMTKIVLLILFVASVLSWAVALYKIILFRIKKQQCKKIISALKKAATFEDLFAIAKVHAHTLPGYFLTRILGNVKEYLLLQESSTSSQSQEKSFDFLQMQTDSLVDEFLYQEESYTSILSASSEVAPLLGLFGTVWGLVHAFMAISEKQSADIAAVAPGIAEALITTVAGLLVAIPALLLFHMVMHQIKKIEYDLVMVADKSLHIVRALFLKKSSMHFSDQKSESIKYSE